MAKREKAPAYQYYPDDFEQGTATYTLAQVGAYQRLLNYQWPKGSVPGDDLEQLSRILRVTSDEAREVWRTISEKFPQKKGLFRNARMERERRKMRAFQRKQAANGRLGGRPPKNPSLSSGLSKSKPKGKAKHKAKKSSPSPSVDRSRRHPLTPSHREGGRLSRDERKLAKRELERFHADEERRWRASGGGKPIRQQREEGLTPHDRRRCPHDPPACADDVACIDKLALERRQRLAKAS